MFVLPELSQSRSYNGVTESSSNFPMVLLDESTADSIGVQVEKLGGDGPYGMVRLTLYALLFSNLGSDLRTVMIG